MTVYEPIEVPFSSIILPESVEIGPDSTRSSGQSTAGPISQPRRRCAVGGWSLLCGTTAAMRKTHSAVLAFLILVQRLAQRRVADRIIPA
jgi:hypothetical protein